MVKCLPAMQETRVQFLGREDPLEKEMATHSSTLAWKIPWTEEPGKLPSMGSQRVEHDCETSLHSLISCVTLESNIMSPSLFLCITLIIPLGLFNKVTQTQYCKAVFLLLVLLPGLWVSGMVLLVSGVAPLILVGSQV